MAVITLTSDFGTQDHYVACMKGVILQTAPKATIVDITHDIAPHGIVQAVAAVAEHHIQLSHRQIGHMPHTGQVEFPKIFQVFSFNAGNNVNR